ncbi:MAG TPA: DUF5009 domain-containing protein [Puia sp.]|nr:DUF5009 domain-containing protein [Puia sp.]
MTTVLHDTPKTPKPSETKKSAPALPDRLYSLDALRGFDMFWIMGADALFHDLANATKSSFFQVIADQLEHPEWNGFHFYDLIFPLFLFMAGVSTPYSIGKQLEKGKTRQQVLLRVIRRGLVLVFLGLVVNNGLEIRPVSDIRFGSVLGRIGLGYMFANIIFLYAKEKAQIAWFWAILIGYWLLLKFTSAPGYPMGDLTMPGNFASYVDRLFMPGKLYKGIHDPEGFLSTIPAVSTALLGILAGGLLKNGKMSGNKKAGWLAGVGAVLIVLSLIWNIDFPINKNLWSSSFTLLVGGISLILLSGFYYIIDVLGYKKWAFFFRVIGMNSILIYVSGHFINWSYTTNAFFKWFGQLAGDPWGAVVMSICLLFVKWMFLYFMYKKRIFLRV